MRTTEYKLWKFSTGKPQHCWRCRCELTIGAATVDHLRPRSKGGPDSPSNYRLACLRCNADRGNKRLSPAEVDRLKGRERPKRRGHEALSESIRRANITPREADQMNTKDSASGSAPVAPELPDSIRAPLHSLWSDAGYLVGRAMGGEGEFAVNAIKARCDEIESAVRAALAVQAAPAAAAPSLTEINSACLSYRHDFGLMDEHEQENMRWAAKEWLRAWRKEFEVAPAAPAEKVNLSEEDVRALTVPSGSFSGVAPAAAPSRGLMLEPEDDEAVEAVQPVAPPKLSIDDAQQWKQAVFDACSTIFLEPGVPRETMNRLIALEQEIALDPEVSDRAAALIARGAQEAPKAEQEDARDAARYRWLRDRAIHAGDDGEETPWCVLGTCAEDANPVGFADLDAAIDAALKREGLT